MDLAQPLLITHEGLEDLKHRLEQARLQRAEALDRVREATQPGDIDDNPEFGQAKEELVAIDDRIYELQEMIGRAQLIKDGHGLHAGPGSTVDVEDADGEVVTYRLVGSIEADPSRGQVSMDSPVGRALIGHKPGDRIAVEVPAGKIEFTVRAFR